MNPGPAKEAPRTAPAFKEWSAAVEALGAGEQIIILRKGGISEGPGGFQVNNSRFWLYPTFFHAQLEKSKPTAAKWFALAESHAPVAANRDASSPLTLRFFAQVEQAVFLSERDRIQSLDPYHLWSNELVRERFDWSKPPGLHVVILRVFRLSTEVILTPTPAMAGCKSWVDVPFDFDAFSSAPVLNDRQFAAQSAKIRSLL